MKPLRNLSARPELVVDTHLSRIVDGGAVTSVGVPGEFGRARCTYALPVNESPSQWLVPNVGVRDSRGFFLADPQGNMIGTQGVWVPRMLAAGKTQDTRRL